MTTDDVVSRLFEAKEGVLEAKAAADAAGIDRDFDDLINQVDNLIYAIQGDL
ncbi:MAG: hypothetical protein ACFN4K_04940 [Pauljensenia sp.]